MTVFEDYVQIAVNNEDASACVVAPATEESNPYFIGTHGSLYDDDGVYEE